MPVSIVVGGQFGSEGKGKVALEIVRCKTAAAVIRVGGTNSGHTAIGADRTRLMRFANCRQRRLIALSRSSFPPALTLIWRF